MKKFSEKPTGMLAASELKTAKGQVIYWAFILVLIISALLSLLPAVWTISTAFKDSQEILLPTFLPSEMSWTRVVTRITETWEKLQIGGAIINTMMRSFGEIVFKLVICGLLGYAISKLKPKGSKTLFVLVVWTMMMPGQIRMVSNYIGYLHFPFAFDMGIGVSLLDTYWPFWLGSAADCFTILLFKNSFDALSNSYVEAAKLDGCSNYGIFFKIMVPLSMPIIIYVSIGAFSGAWSDYMGPLLYLDKNKTVPLVMYLNKNNNVKMNDQFMGYIFSSIPPFLIFAIFQRHILGGINVGGVKG